MFSEARAQRAISFFEHLKHTKGKFAGQPFALLPWERKIVWDVYGTLKEDGTRQYKYVYIEIPKKNGKSELGAGAALYHTFADGEISGEVYSCAADKKQAGIIYKVANEMIGWAPALAKRAKINDSFQTIKDRKTGTSYVVLSAEAYTKHGLNLSACIFDELHAQPNRDLWDVMTFGAGHFYVSQSDKGGLVFGGDIEGYNSYAQRGNLPVIEDVCEGGMALMPVIGRLRILRSWGGLIDMTMDGSPIIDFTPAYEPPLYALCISLFWQVRVVTNERTSCYWSFPRPSMGHRSITKPPLWTMNSAYRLLVVQPCEGMISMRSPSLIVESCGTVIFKCSSDP